MTTDERRENWAVHEPDSFGPDYRYVFDQPYSEVVKTSSNGARIYLVEEWEFDV